MERNDKIKIAAGLIGGTAGCFTSWYLGRMLTALFTPKTLALKIGATIFGAVIARWISKQVEKEITEIAEDFCAAKDEFDALKEITTTNEEVTATVTE